MHAAEKEGEKKKASSEGFYGEESGIIRSMSGIKAFKYCLALVLILPVATCF